MNSHETRKVLINGVPHLAHGEVCRLESGEVVFVVRKTERLEKPKTRKIPKPKPPDTIHDVFEEERKRRKVSKRMKEFWRSDSPSVEKVAKNWDSRN